MSSTPPLILVVADRKPVTTGAWADIVNDALPHSYIHAVEQAGGMPVLLPPSEVLRENAERLLDLADGVFLAGGRDLDADLYGRGTHPLNDRPLRVRDELEIALANGARARSIPVLGACRGMQVLNVAAGGTLEQHLADRLDMTPHRDVVGSFTAHAVSVVGDSRLREVLGSTEFSIDSHHHQAVEDLGVGLIASAHAHDGVIEAIEAPGEPFTLGVQWHPEENLAPEGIRLLAAFIRASSEYKNAVRESGAVVRG